MLGGVQLKRIPDLPDNQRAIDRAWIIAADEHGDRQPRAEFRLGGRLDLLYQDFILVTVTGRQGNHVDLDAIEPGQAGLLLGVAEVFVAVAQKNNAFACPFREGSQGKLDGG